LGQSLGLEVMAEGVETLAQKEFLMDIGCHAFQGYFFSKPLPSQSFEVFVNRCELA
jgi:EAL domain-containing protein (putative c-di-GMP-specific phosphodiesterase class I)